MSIEQCPICWTQASADCPVIPVDSHDDRHRFHEVCLFNWFQYNNTCPLCVKKVRRLNDPRQAPPADKAAAVAQGILVTEHPIITALRHGQPLDPLLLAEGNITPWVRENAIRVAALYGRQAALERLIETDSESAIAIAFLIPNHMDLVNTIIDRVENPYLVRKEAIIEAAEAGNQESLNHLCRNDIDRAIAIAHAISHPHLVQALFAETDDQELVRTTAIGFAASNNLRPALDALIQTDIHRAVAISRAAPAHMELVNALFEQANDQEYVRRWAISFTASNNSRPALDALIQTDTHRAVAIVHAAPDHMELVNTLLEQADDQELVRKKAIELAGTNNLRPVLDALIQTDMHRAVAIVHAAPDHMELVDAILEQANDQEFVRTRAIVLAGTNNLRPALDALIQTDMHRAYAIFAAAPDHMELVDAILEQANDQEFVRIRAIALAGINNLRPALDALIQTDMHRGYAIFAAAPDHMELLNAILEQANDQESVRRTAIRLAVENNLRPALDALIQTDIHRAIAISKAAPNHMELVTSLFEQADDQECVRRNAIRFAAASNLQPALEALIQTDSHRAIAIAHVAHAHVELTHALLEQANDREFTRRDAIVMAASLHQRETLAILIRSDEDRGIAMAYTVARPNLVRTLLQQANHQEVAKKKAIEVAALNGKLDALNVILENRPKKSFFSSFFR